MANVHAHHFGVTVTDLDRTVEFYRDVLGFPILDRSTVAGEGFSTGVDVESATGHFVHLDAGDVRVELIEYDPEGSARPGGRVNQPGVKHLGFEVENIDAFYEELPTGVETLNEPQTTQSGTRILFLRDPEANLVELIES